MLPGQVGLKVRSLFCTKSGSWQTRSIMSWSLGVEGFAWWDDTITPGLGLEGRGPPAFLMGVLLLTAGFTCPGLGLFSSRLSSNESIVFSKNWRHSCSS